MFKATIFKRSVLSGGTVLWKDGNFAVENRFPAFQPTFMHRPQNHWDGHHRFTQVAFESLKSSVLISDYSFTLT